MSDVRKVLRIYCPVCRKKVVPEWEREHPLDTPVPVCPYCGLQLTKNVIESFKGENYE